MRGGDGMRLCTVLRSDAGVLDRPLRPVRDQLDQLHQDNAESGWCTG